MGVLEVTGARVDGAAPDVRTIADAVTYAGPAGFRGTPIDKAAGDYGAIYFPWLWSVDPIGTGRNPRILLPPSGFLAGIYARTDNSRGVFKAPAGTEAGTAGAIAVATTVSDAEQDRLNPIKVNVIRTVPGSGIVVWGTRTIGSDAEWRYIPVRRMAIFLRTSIYYGIQWAVFEPNDEPLWASLRLNIRAFMLTQFRAGAFQGSKPDDAFFVKCDSDTTTQADIDNGVVNILVGFAPLKPAEFVVLRLQQKVNQQVA
jgi:phage tail sheath protein FI